MTITIPTTYEIAALGALALPQADAEPLAVAHRNANAFWSLYRPPLRSTIYMDEASSVGQRRYRMAVIPSADGIVYRFRHRVRTGTGTTGIDVTVEWQTAGGGWTSIYSATTAAGASTVVQVSHTATIPAAADEIRITYDRGADPYLADSVLVVPEPAAPSTRTTSGMWPYDDGLLTAAGAPINTELVTRPWRSTYAVHVDRQKCIASLTQRDDTDALYDPSGGSATTGEWVLMGRGVASVPYAPPTVTVEVRVIATAATTGTDRVRVIVGGVAATLDASAGVESATITAAQVSAPGSLTASVDVEVWCVGDSGDLLQLHDAAVWVQPWLPSTLPLAATSVDPAATMQLLHAVVRETERRCMAPWPQPAHMMDGISTGLTSRSVEVSIPPACQRARLAMLRSGTGVGTIQTSSTIETTTTSGVPASPGTAIVTVPTWMRGTEGYLDLAGDAGAPSVLWSSSGFDVSGTPPASTADRQVELVEALAPGIETVQVGYTCGMTLHYVRVRSQADYGDI